MSRAFAGAFAVAIMLLLGACAAGVVPIPVPLGTAPAGDATPPGPEGIEGDT